MIDDRQPSIHYLVNKSTIEITMPDGSPSTAEVLYQALEDEDAEVRVSAALALAKLGDLSPTVVNSLFNAADWRSDPEASSAARHGITALAQTNTMLIEQLLVALHAQQGRLSGVAECLGKIGQATPAVIDGLLAFSRSSTDSYAVVAAIHSLLMLGYQSDELYTRLNGQYDRGDEIVQNVALQAMGLVSQPSTEMVKRLRLALRQGGRQSRYAAQALVHAGLESAQMVDELIEIASDAKDWQARAAAIGALGKLANPTPAVMDTLCNALLDQEWFVRREAIDSLGGLHNPTPQVIERLLALLAAEEAKQPARSTPDEHADNPRAVLAALRQSQSLRGDIAMTLAQLGCVNDAVMAAFLAELGSEDASVRERIVRNWWLLGDNNSSALAALQSALDDESAMVRERAAASLARLR